MSVSLLLVPAALAIAGVIGGAGVAGAMSQREEETAPAGGGGPTSVAVQTRMKDASLLGAALHDLGAVNVHNSDGALTATIDDLELRMTRDAEGIWAAHVAGSDGREAHRAEAEQLIARLDAAYARQVQQAVAARIRDRADDAGFELMSESRESDDSVTMVLSVRQER